MEPTGKLSEAAKARSSLFTCGPASCRSPCARPDSSLRLATQHSFSLANCHPTNFITWYLLSFLHFAFPPTYSPYSQLPHLEPTRLLLSQAKLAAYDFFNGLRTRASSIV